MTSGMKLVEEALREAEREREAAVRAAEEALHLEYAHRIEAIRLQYSGEMAAHAELAEKRAAEKMEDRIAVLTEALESANAALLAAEREAGIVLHAAEATARAELERQLAALRAGHADELEAQARTAQARFAEELMSALATAHADWKQETEKRLREAKEEGLRVLARAQANWRRRHKMTLWRAARLWRTRERGRLAEAERQWQAVHRQALDAGDRRWQLRLERVKRRARRSLWQAGPAQRARVWIVAFARAQIAFRPSENNCFVGAKPAAAPLGIMAIALIIIAVHFLPAAPFPDAVPEPMATASARPMPREPIPGHTRDGVKTPRADEGAARRPILSEPMETATVFPGGQDDVQSTESELRRRLQDKIRMLRTVHPAQ